MLVFQRQQGQSFHVGDDVEVRILRLSRSHVKIGVIAPREIEVFRTELSALNRRAVVGDWSDPLVSARLRTLVGSLGSVKKNSQAEDRPSPGAPK